ncbi:MAG: hypothetical protein AAFU85_16825, partial [Planctomycetota bacterium]
MSTNPYQSPIDAAEPEEEIQPPRYLGKVRTIQGSLKEDEALALVKNRKPLELRDMPKTEGKKQTSWVWAICCFLLVGVSFIIVDSSAMSSSGGFLGWWCVGIPAVFVISVLVAGSLV